MCGHARYCAEYRFPLGLQILFSYLLYLVTRKEVAIDMFCFFFRTDFFPRIVYNTCIIFYSLGLYLEPVLLLALILLQSEECFFFFFFGIRSISFAILL